MSIKLMTAVWENDQTKGSERLVLLALADMANDQGVCWPSYDTIAKKANIARRNVIKHVKTLIGKDLVSKNTRFRKNGNEVEYTSNYYTIKIPPQVVVTEPTPPSDGRVTTPSDEDITTLVTGASPKALINHHLEPSINHYGDPIEIYKEVTGLTPHVGIYNTVKENITSAISHSDCDDPIKYLKKFYLLWKNGRTKDGRKYNPTNHKWIEWAITGYTPEKINKAEASGYKPIVVGKQ